MRAERQAVTCRSERRRSARRGRSTEQPPEARAGDDRCETQRARQRDCAVDIGDCWSWTFAQERPLLEPVAVAVEASEAQRERPCERGFDQPGVRARVLRAV